MEIPPGSYLIEGDSNDIFYRCDRPMLGIVIEKQQDSDKALSSILVDGKVILLWDDSSRIQKRQQLNQGNTK